MFEMFGFHLLNDEEQVLKKDTGRLIILVHHTHKNTGSV